LFDFHSGKFSDILIDVCKKNETIVKTRITRESFSAPWVVLTVQSSIKGTKMDRIERIGVSLDKELLSMFDELIAKQGYQSRSEKSGSATQKPRG